MTPIIIKINIDIDENHLFESQWVWYWLLFRPGNFFPGDDFRLLCHRREIIAEMRWMQLQVWT